MPPTPRGTHHKLALDALRHLKCMDADLWQRLFLAHAKLYLEGSKAPDNEFKDFKNHVLHTRDGYWGGAPEKVRSWYHHLVEALAQQDWPTAVYCAGVLSHYYTDPLHPFHTAQSEAENNIHRAVEWSISKAYDELRDAGRARVRQHRRRAAARAELAGAARLPGRGEGQRLLREADRPLRHPARRDRSAGGPRPRGQAHRRRADPLRHAQLRRRAGPRHRGVQRARARRLAGGGNAGGGAGAVQAASPGASPTPRSAASSSACTTSCSPPARWRRTCPRTTARCATCMPRRCWPSGRRSRRCPRCFPSSRASGSSRASTSERARPTATQRRRRQRRRLAPRRPRAAPAAPSAITAAECASPAQPAPAPRTAGLTERLERSRWRRPRRERSLRPRPAAPAPSRASISRSTGCRRRPLDRSQDGRAPASARHQDHPGPDARPSLRRWRCW